jgi:Fic family protein
MAQQDWPNVTLDHAKLAASLASVRYQQGRLVGHMEALGFQLRQLAILSTVTADVVSGSEIEGDPARAAHVRWAVARRLGLDVDNPAVPDHAVEGFVEMRVDATRRYDDPLSADRLRGWHRLLLPDARGYANPRAAGDVQKFTDWFEGGDEASGPLDPVLKAGLAHLWFLAIHPFDQGNRRIALAISDLALARSERSPRRFYSLSAQIRVDIAAYGDILDRTQQDSLGVTPWLEWFLGCLGRAIDHAQAAHAGVLARARFWRAHPDLAVNERQRRLIDRLLDADVATSGELTSSTWARLAACSHDTALRDILPLVARGILVRSTSGGRSTSYALRTNG